MSPTQAQEPEALLLCRPCAQLALDNALAPYFQSTFGFGITKAANLAAIFGMMNFWARPCGGIASDYAARRYGMRGRLWVLFTVVALGGARTPDSNTSRCRPAQCEYSLRGCPWLPSQ